MKHSLLPVVLSQAPHEAKQVEKLIQWCRDLDGTEIRVFTHDEPAGISYPEVANWSFRQVAKEMQGQPFIWIEADSVPLKAGWAADLTKEYHRQRKEYLYPLQFNPPHDIYSGIGVQGPNAYNECPDGPFPGGFDEFIVTRHPEKIGRTALIRHNYGSYDEKGDVTLHQFPRDINLIGPEAVIFHKDKKLELIDYLRSPGLTVSSAGDIGDCALLLCLMKQIPGGPHTLALRPSPLTKSKDDEKVKRLHDAIAPLALAQRYIKDVKIIEADTKVDWASEGFRKLGHYRKGETLMQAHQHHLIKTKGIGRDFRDDQPWLNVRKAEDVSDRVVINRTSRYRNDNFPWAQIVKHLGSRLLFVGHEDEWREFCKSFGTVEYRRTANMLEVAELIAGSALFIGNQSSANACAEGLKHNSIQEVCLELPDCIYRRPNAQYVADGVVHLPDGTVIRGPEPQRDRGARKLMQAPPRYWQYPGCAPSPSFPVIARMVQQLEKVSLEEAEDRLYEANVARCPAFFQDASAQQKLERYRAAMGMA